MSKIIMQVGETSEFQMIENVGSIYILANWNFSLDKFKFFPWDAVIFYLRNCNFSLEMLWFFTWETVIFPLLSEIFYFKNCNFYLFPGISGQSGEGHSLGNSPESSTFPQVYCTVCQRVKKNNNNITAVYSKSGSAGNILLTPIRILKKHSKTSKNHKRKLLIKQLINKDFSFSV